jgi:DNA polymerase III subunit delta'
MKGIIGHARIVSIFDRLLESGQLSHAYCLVGPSHIGKYTLVKRIAAQYLHSSGADVSRHPDVFELSPEEKENGKIKIDAVRQCREFLSQTSAHGYGLVVLIDQAHTMTDEAANALLKSLEEPPDKALFLLVTSSPSLLPTTVMSRCQTIQCVPASQEEVSRELEPTTMSEEDKKICASIAHGRIGIVRSCVESPEFLLRIKELYTQAVALRTSPLYEKIQIIDTIIKDESLLLADRVSYWCSADMSHLRQSLYQGEAVYAVGDRICRYPDVLHILHTNTNKQMSLEQFLF